MIEVGVLKNFDSGTYKAGVQLAGSLTTYFDDINVAKNIPSSAMVVGNYVILAIPGGNPKDACVIASWPGGSPGGGGSGTKIQDADGDTSWDVEPSPDADEVVGKVKGVEAFRLHNDGILDLAKQSGCRVYRATSNQPIPTAAWTKIQFNAEVFDTQNEFDPSVNYRFTTKRAGIYLIALTVAITSIASDHFMGASIWKNGGEVQTVFSHPPATLTWTLQTIMVTQLAVNDYIEGYAYQQEGADREIRYLEKNTNLTILKVN